MFLTQSLLAALPLVASIIALPIQLPYERTEFASTTLATREEVPAPGRVPVLENTVQAGQLNKKFAELTPSSPCVGDERACVTGSFAKCVNGSFVLSPRGENCTAVPRTDGHGIRLSYMLRATPIDSSDENIPKPSKVSDTPRPPPLSKRQLPTPPPACPAKWKDFTSAPDGYMYRRPPGEVQEKWVDGCDNHVKGKEHKRCINFYRDATSSIHWGSPDADPCDQQDRAVELIRYAQNLPNKEMFIEVAVEFARQPHQAAKFGDVMVSSPYCRKDPGVAELRGVFPGQLEGANPGLYYSALDQAVYAFGDERFCPFGKKPNLNACICE